MLIATVPLQFLRSTALPTAIYWFNMAVHSGGSRTGVNLGSRVMVDSTLGLSTRPRGGC